MLLQTAEKARETASKAWDDALLPLDRKLALYTSDLRQWSAGKTGPCPSARAEFLALVKSYELGALQHVYFRSGVVWLDQRLHTFLKTF